MKQGVVVAMATHNSEPFIERTLASINRSFEGSGREYALVIADDASTDRTLAKARRFDSTAAHRSTLGFKKASCVGESKNRASLMARPFFDRYPWVLWMDDDDEMLPGRLQLIDKMEAQGQKAGVGDWAHSLDNGSRIEHITGDWSIANRCFSPCMTAIHSSLVPSNGRYFHHAPTNVYEDLATHHLMTMSGVPWCYHGGAEIHVYHRRSDSWSGTGTRSMDLLKSSVPYLDRFGSRTTISSFCTVAIGELAISEVELLVYSLRRTGNEQPIVVLTDADGMASPVMREILQTQSNIIPHPFDWKQAHGGMFPNWGTKYSAANLTPEIMLCKMVVLQYAVERFGNTLFLDSDQIVLRKIHSRLEGFGVVHEAPNSMKYPTPGETWNIQFLGCYNGGAAFVDRPNLNLIEQWRDKFLESYIWCGDDMAPNGGFNDQTCLEEVVMLADRFSPLHPGFSVSAYRLPRGTWPLVKESGDIAGRTQIAGTNDLFFRGWPIVSIHQHFRGQFKDTHGADLFHTVLARSIRPEHVDILKKLGPAPALPARRRPRYIEQKV
jgi:glycosyltransferase involved in cell wall biosynthesis